MSKRSSRISNVSLIIENKTKIYNFVLKINFMYKNWKKQKTKAAHSVNFVKLNLFRHFQSLSQTILFTYRSYCY